jgi:voltage-gated potassium channel
MTDPDRERLARYEHRTSPFLLALALAFLLLYAIPVVWPDLPDAAQSAVEAVSFVIWGAFVIDLAARAWLSGRPMAYLVRHPIDVLLILLPMLRPLRVLRVFTAANYVIERGGRFALGRTVASALAATGLLMLIAALAELDAERYAPGSSIHTFGDALWWAGVTVTTVGYGDVYPVTTEGRFVAFGLMLVGISVLGVITASVAAWFVSRTREGDDEVIAAIRALREELQAMRSEREDR